MQKKRLVKMQKIALIAVSLSNKKDLEMYKQRLEARRLHNEEVNRKSTKLHIIWFCIFAIFIALTSWMVN